MRSLVWAAFLLLVAQSASEAKPSTATMSCVAAQAMVEKLGAVVFTTGPTTYDRYVASRAFCTISETLEPAFVPAADHPQCFVGYRCREFIGHDRR